jgi:hypothetical protein
MSAYQIILDAKAILTAYHAPQGPSKADTIAKLTELLATPMDFMEPLLPQGWTFDASNDGEKTSFYLMSPSRKTYFGSAPTYKSGLLAFFRDPVRTMDSEVLMELQAAVGVSRGSK